MNGSHRKAGAGKFGWKWGKKYSFLFQVAKMILDVKGFID
jgi:hypothetical protein